MIIKNILCFFCLGLMMYPHLGYAVRGAKPGTVGKSSHKVRSGTGAVSRVSSTARLIGGGKRPDPSGDKRKIALRLLEDESTKDLSAMEDSLKEQVVEDIPDLPVIRNKPSVEQKVEDFLVAHDGVFSTTDFMYALGIKEMAQAVEILRSLENHKIISVKRGIGVFDPSLWVALEVIGILEEGRNRSREQAKDILIKDYERKQELIKSGKHFVSKQEGAFSSADVTANLRLSLGERSFVLSYLTVRGEIVLLWEGMSRLDPSIWVSAELFRQLQNNHYMNEAAARIWFLEKYSTKKPSENPIDLNTDKGKVRGYARWAPRAFSTVDVAYTWGMKPRQSTRHLNDLKDKEVVLLKPGTSSKNNPDVWASLAVVDALKERRDISRKQAKDILIKDYERKQELIKSGKHFVSKQEGAFSSADVTANLRLSLGERSFVLSYLTVRGEIVLLWEGMSRLDPSIWVSAELFRQLQNSHYMNEAVARIWFLEKYSAKKPSENPIDLNTEKGKVRGYARWAPGAFSSIEVTHIWEMEPQQSIRHLNNLKDKEIVLLRQGTRSKSNPSVWASVTVLEEKTKKVSNKQEAIKLLLREYDTRPKPQKPLKPIDLRTIKGRVTAFVYQQTEAFSSTNVTESLNFKSNQRVKSNQSVRALLSLNNEGRIILLRQGTGNASNPNIWATPEVLNAKMRNGLSRKKAIELLLSEYDAKSINFDQITWLVRHYVQGKQGAFSGVDIATVLGITSTQSHGVLRSLKGKEVTLIRPGTSGINALNVFVSSERLKERAKNASSEQKVIEQLLMEYDARLKLSKPIDLSTAIGRVRNYMRWSLGAFSTVDIAVALGIQQSQARKTLGHLNERDEVVRLRKNVGSGNSSIWVSRKQFEALEAKYNDEHIARQELLKAYYRKIETLEELQISVAKSKEQTNEDARSILQLTEQQAGFVTQTLFTLADMFPDGNFADNQRDVFQDIISRHVGLGDAFLSLAETLNNQGVELSPRDAFALIWRASNIEDTEGILVSKSLDLPGHVESLAVVELIYTIIAQGSSLSVDSGTLSDSIEPLNWLFEQWEMQTAAGVN